jgi:hypothetical protein
VHDSLLGAGFTGPSGSRPGSGIGSGSGFGPLIGLDARLNLERRAVLCKGHTMPCYAMAAGPPPTMLSRELTTASHSCAARTKRTGRTTIHGSAEILSNREFH